MAYLRTPFTDGVGETWIDVIIQDLDYSASTYTELNLFCLETGQGFDVRFKSGAGGSPGTYRTGAQRFDNLLPGSTYNFYAEATYGGGDRRIPDSGYYSFSTLAGTGPAPYNVSISEDSMDGKTIDVIVTWMGQANEVRYDVSWISGFPDNVHSVSTLATFHERSFTAPAYSTPYYIDVQVSGPGGTSNWETLYIMTDPEPIVVGSTSITSLSDFASNAIRVNWSYATNAVYYEVQYRVSGSSTWLYAAYSQSGNDFLVTGLQPSTDYQFRVRGYQGSSYGAWSSAVPGRTLSNIPTAFNWTYAKVQGGEYNLKAQEWNALGSKINQFREYKGLSNYPFSTAYVNAIFYASYYNEVRAAINDMGPVTSIPAIRYAGDDVTAAVLNRLRDSLNSLN
ncbi:fibronectin type III domain-containing protein [Domibacillus enclensis]|uniref:Fibronectin type III domain-containing protein n=1 Tax=Domibacillus enclensis TaxID=1017273 RepID=A0A1N6WKT2_9BACI|nr:fibronectin type III domain-containing protein [Domibacillus enclensis]OXS77968.1 hypothetical protein B1B05_10200 [Domibacillus enclensis]SIQ90733.1 Fibronectin type III domain-containing protein [Domibacillus enclensis]